MRRALPTLVLCLAVPAALAVPPKRGPAAVHGLDLAGMDRAVAPGDDFYAHANGAWARRTAIPADRGSFGVSQQVADLTDARTASLIKAAAAAKAPAGSDPRKIGEFYTSFMDERRIEARGLAPMRPIFAAIGSIRDRADLARYLGATLRADVDALNATNLSTTNLFGLWVAQDLDEPTRYSPFLLQGGLGLPERTYYLDASEEMAAIRSRYRDHVAAMLRLAGLPGGTARAAAVLALETRMAQVHASREDTDDVKKGNNHWTRADFTRRAPGLDWEAFFTAAQLQKAEAFVVWQPGACQGLSALTAEVPLDTWKDYLTFHALQHRAPVLPKAVADQSFAFYGKVLSGASKPPPRWKTGVSQTNLALGQAVGRAYVARYFPATEKARAQQLVANIIAAFRLRIERLDWMTAATKARAVAKLATLKVGVG